MEKINNDNELPEELNNIMCNFIKLKESYMKERNLRQECFGVMKNLKEENRIIQEVEKTERNKLNITRQLVEQQQDNISNLLLVKSENLRLTSLVKELSDALEEQKIKLADERQKWDTEEKQLQARHTIEMEEMKLEYEKKALDTRRALESSVAILRLEIFELKRKLKDKENELSLTKFRYEEKLKKMEEKQNSAEAETRKIKDWAAHDVALHKKKSLELEQEFNRLLKSRQEESSIQTLRKMYENPLPKPESSKYLNPAHAPVTQNKPQRVQLQTILKKTSAYSLNIRQTFLSSPDDFKNSLQNAVSEEKNNKLLSVPSSTTNASTSESVPPPPPPETCQNNSSTSEKLKVNIIKKRKLFRPNDQDFD